jgi:hypothetical protein
LLATAAALVGPPLHAQQPPSHIPFCSSDSSARAFVEQIRFRVAGTDMESRQAQAAVGLVPMASEQVTLVMEEAICLAASAAYAGQGGVGSGMPAPFPVAVVQAGDRYLVRLADAVPSARDDPRTIVFDSGFRPLGSYGTGP